MASSVETRTIIYASFGAAVTGLVAYAFYFDYKRRNDASFRKSLKREAKKQQKAAKEEAEAGANAQRAAIRQAVQSVNEEGLPTDPEKVEDYFMTEVSKGEEMAQKGADPIDAALCFYRALKIYPQPDKLITIYENTVPKPILDILAEMIALDASIPIGKPESHVE
ncbi:protein import receptor MAS20 [Saccharata proteae CBS 121410]|uniref:Mitochondrial import receptor subunit TOM20 n=1 Tax=Saccharata proteae CBS 121410 TaxID=1314787 RepID=A0A9P4LTA2_9PEZI|nr:protein import receptor MAS20 [Saccharata proteae CBS 121410]